MELRNIPLLAEEGSEARARQGEASREAAQPGAKRERDSAKQ